MAHRKKKIPAQLVEDEDYQLRHEKVAGIDIAKDKGDVCTRLPAAREGGRRRSRVLQDVPARAQDILDLGAQLIADGVELVVMESTSDYWRIWYYLLESLGLAVALVNSSHARQLAGGRRPTGWTASGWRGWPRWGCCAPRSCRRRRSGRCGTWPVPGPSWSGTGPGPGSGWRSCWKAPDQAVVGAVVPGAVKTARLILDALADGERDPGALAALALGSLQRRAPTWRSLDGMMIGAHHALLIRARLNEVDSLSRSIGAVEDELAAALEAIPAAGA